MDAKINVDYLTFAFDLKIKTTNWINALKACGDSTVMKNTIEIFKDYSRVKRYNISLQYFFDYIYITS